MSLAPPVAVAVESPPYNHGKAHHQEEHEEQLR